MKSKLVLVLGGLLVFGLIFVACDMDNNGNLTLTGYSKSAAGIRSVSRSVSTYRAVSNETYTLSDYRTFPIDNQGDPVTFRDVTVRSIHQFEREVPGYDDNPNDFVGYLNNHSSYPSDAHVTKEEKVILVFDSRKPTERYGVGYHHINLSIANSNLQYFEDLVAQGKQISIFHVDAATLTNNGPENTTTCWVIQWIPESEGGVPGNQF
jgi:hypothetical protein